MAAAAAAAAVVVVVLFMFVGDDGLVVMQESRDGKMSLDSLVVSRQTKGKEKNCGETQSNAVIVALSVRWIALTWREIVENLVCGGFRSSIGWLAGWLAGVFTCFSS